MSGQHWVPFGRIGRARGLAGEVSVWPYNEDSSNVSALRQVRVEPGGALYAVDSVRRLARSVGMRLSGVSDHRAAQALCGSELFCLRDEWETPADGQHYAVDLVGCRVEGLPDGIRGQVRAVLFYAGRPVLETELRAPDGRTGLLDIPYASAIASSVDVAAGCITVHLPDGLMEIAQWT
jgi:16S rRNA processing protein RimM